MNNMTNNKSQGEKRCGTVLGVHYTDSRLPAASLVDQRKPRAAQPQEPNGATRTQADVPSSAYVPPGRRTGS